MVAVLGASGGVGASVLAVAVAVRGRRAGRDVVLVDGCPLGGGLDVTLGAEQQDGIRWPDLGGLVGSADGRALVARLPQVDGVPVLSFDRVGDEPSQEVVSAILSALAGEGALVVVDVAVRAGIVAEAGLAAASHVVVLAGDGMRQLAALSVVVPRLRQGTAASTELAVCLRTRHSTAAPVARVVESELQLPVLFTVDDDTGVRADLVHGIAPGSRGRGAVVRAADDVLGWAVLDGREVA